MANAVNKQNFEQWSIVSALYNDVRPIPPDVITKVILSWLGRTPEIVVDVGCGTGLSSTIWKDIAKKVIGVEPNDDMRRIAVENVGSNHVSFVKAFSNDMGMPSDYADVITVSQAFHWMDIDSSLKEFHKVLGPGGILAIYDFTLPPVFGCEIEKPFLELRKKASSIWYSQATPPIHNDKSSYIGRIMSFGQFQHSRSVSCHGIERWSPEKAAAFLVHISNAEFAMKIDETIKDDVESFINLVNHRYCDDFDIIFHYNIVLAVK